MLGEVMLDARMTLSEMLKRHGKEYSASVYETLGLMGKTHPVAQRAEISAAMSQKSFLAAVVRQLPASSQKLLKTLVQAGGFVPVSVLYQHTGPEAPPTDVTLPLVERGLIYLGRDGKSKRKDDLPKIAVVPIDLLDRLTSVMRVTYESF